MHNFCGSKSTYGNCNVSFSSVHKIVLVGIPDWKVIKCRATAIRLCSEFSLKIKKALQNYIFWRKIFLLKKYSSKKQFFKKMLSSLKAPLRKRVGIKYAGATWLSCSVEMSCETRLQTEYRETRIPMPMHKCFFDGKQVGGLSESPVL